MPKYPHRPPHIYLNKTWYFITAHTYRQSKIFRSTQHKSIWLNTLQQIAPDYKVTPYAWVLMWNHYHLLIYIEQSKQLPKFIQRFHGLTAFEINKVDQMRGRTIWYNYWDHCVRDEKDFWTKFNYIHHNPVKHGYVDQMDKWDISSFSNFIEQFGIDWMNDVIQTYPVVDYSFEYGKDAD